MQRLVSRDQLSQALELVPAAAWSFPSTVDATRVHHGYRQVSLVESGSFRLSAAVWRFVLDEFAPVRDAWLSWIDPGGFILPHRDAGPHYERWQVPIQPAGYLAHEDDARPSATGEPFRVEHWRTHSVVNDADHPRIHLVLDRDVCVRPEASPFELIKGGLHGQ